MEITGVAAIFLEILAEIEDKVVDSAGGRVNVITPNYLQDLLAGYNFPFIFDQQFQQHGFLLAKFMPFAILTNAFLRCKVDAVIAKFINVRNTILILDSLILDDQLFNAE